MRNNVVQNILFLLLIAASIVVIILSRTGMLTLGIFILIPYMLLFICVWMMCSLNMTRKAIKNLYDAPSDKRAEIFANLLRKTFAVEAFIPMEALTDVYRYTINLKQVSHTTKKLLYEAFDKKCIAVPYPPIPKRTAMGIKRL